MLTPIPPEHANPQTLTALQPCHIPWLKAIAAGEAGFTFKLTHEDTARLLLDALARLGSRDEDGNPGFELSEKREDIVLFAFLAASEASKQLGRAQHPDNIESNISFKMALGEAIWNLQRSLWLAESLHPGLKPVDILSQGGAQ
ncbi:MAG: hypothetical protein AB7S38_28845 [Vulcanimicrobiota bacterium]